MKTSERIRAIRKEHDYTQRYVAYKLGISQRTYSDYERDKIRLCTDQLIALGHLYDKSLDYIAGVTCVDSPLPQD